MTGCLLQAFQQLTGINFIFYYGTSYFSSADMGDPFIITMITNSVNMLATIPGLFMIERWGRRPLLLFGGIGMAISQFLVAGLGTGLARSDATNKASIVLICVLVDGIQLAYQLGIGLLRSLYGWFRNGKFESTSQNVFHLG